MDGSLSAALDNVKTRSLVQELGFGNTGAAAQALGGGLLSTCICIAITVSLMSELDVL